MGQAKQKQYGRKKFLQEHPLCCYCGDKATTTDHCPPRSLFYDRKWPEGYEFPACEKCNAEGRKIENVISVIYRISLKMDGKDPHLKKLITGMRNNYPEIAEELISNKNRRWQRQQFRERYGDAGDDMRQRGFGIATIGPKTRAAMKYFGEKLSKALYYKHIGRRLEGQLFCKSIYIDRNPDFLDTILKLAPANAELQRESRNLAHQFFYRFNYNADMGIFYAVVAFKEQLGYNILAMEQEFYNSFVVNQPNTIAALKEIFDDKKADKNVAK